jgi:hypothetical protein
MEAKPVFINEQVTKAIADVQENRECYIEGLYDLNDYIIRECENSREALSMLSTISIMRRIILGISSGTAPTPEQP